MERENREACKERECEDRKNKYSDKGGGYKSDGEDRKMYFFLSLTKCVLIILVSELMEKRYLTMKCIVSAFCIFANLEL